MSEAKGPWPHTTSYQTRWLDNDQYGHLNNSAYYLIADSVINAYLVNHCGIQPFLPPSSPTAPSGDEDVKGVVGLVISNSCRYYASCSFPHPLSVRLRVVKLGKSSVTYQVAIAEQGTNEEQAAALITSTHVFVDRITRRPVSMPKRLRDPLQRLVVDIEGHERASKL